MSATQSSARAEFYAVLSNPDGPLTEGAKPRPLAVAASTAVGLAGAGAFLAVLAAGFATTTMASSVGVGTVIEDALVLAAVPPLTFVLSVPPLYLATALRGRAPGLLRLLAVASAGPAAAGTWLGATAPLLLLYLMTGMSVDYAFGLLALMLGLMATGLGAWGAVRTGRRVGPQSPGLVLVLAHYAFTLWTGLVLAIHLFA
jgi:hypothetical protein